MDKPKDMTPTPSPGGHVTSVTAPSETALPRLQSLAPARASAPVRLTASSAAWSWDRRHKTWRRFTSIISSARAADEPPPFTDE
jgi:hypothetical protein